MVNEIDEELIMPSDEYLNQFSNPHLNDELIKPKVVVATKVKNIAKEIKADLTPEDRAYFQQLVYTPNEMTSGVITDLEMDRHFYHAYKLGANELSLMTNQPIKVSISDRIFKLSKRVLTPEDMGVINARLYGANNISSQLSNKLDANVAYAIKLSKLPDDIVKHLSSDEIHDILRFRVNITSVALDLSTGEENSLRIINPDPMTFDQMAVEDYIRDSYKRHTDGLVIICGATGNGKTSLLSGFVCDMITSGKDLKIITYEAPIEIRYDKLLNSCDHNVILTQTEIYKHLRSFQDGVINSLRRTAKVAIVGESRDYSTIAASIEFAQTGGLLFTTLHVNNSVAEAFYRMVNMFPENERSIKVFEILESMRLCVIQRLEKSKKGGRIAIREALEFTPDIIAELRKKSSLREMIADIKHFVKTRGFSMADSARKKYAEGHLTEDRLAYYEKLDSVDVI